MAFKFNISFDSRRKKKLATVENKSTKAGTQDKIKREQLYRIKQRVGEWRSALQQAERVHNPDRTDLYRTYYDVMLDAHLTAVIETRKLASVAKPFKILVNDKEDEDLQKMFESSWFTKYKDYTLDARFWGTTIIEIDDIKDGQVTGISRIPYEYVLSEKHLIKDILRSQVGFDYTASPLSDYLIEIGDRFDLGLLNKAAPLVIWKKGALGAWSVRSDVFGMPFRIGKTDTRDPESRQAMIDTLEDSEGASWAVFDHEDDIELREVSNADGHEIYKEQIDTINSELSKLIIGQTGTTDEKSFVGSAEVHERVAGHYTQSDTEHINHSVNKKLIPLLIKHGVVPEGTVFQEDETENLPLLEQIEIDEKLLQYFDIPEEVIKERYGTEVIKKQPVSPESQNIPTENITIMPNVGNLYEDFFKDDKCC